MSKGLRGQREAETTKAIGARLREARTATGLSLYQLSDVSAEPDESWRIPVVVLGSYERGERAATAAKLVELASLYEVDAAWLLTGVFSKPASEAAELLSEVAITLFNAAEELNPGSCFVEVGPPEGVEPPEDTELVMVTIVSDPAAQA
jgi:transcriptional regulator with XRE-family HTH domain